MRIDKYLKVSRIIKRRETAKDLCDDKDVFINGKVAKPMSDVNPGDTIVVLIGRHKLAVKVLAIRTFAKKEDAQGMYEIISDETIERATVSE